MRSRPRTLVLVNPTSGAGRSARVLPLIADYFRKQEFPADFAITGSIEDMRQRAASAGLQGYARVAALGGDGAFHHVLSGAFGTSVTLAFLPAGGGNDIAVALGIPTDPLQAAQALLHFRPRPVDVLRATFGDGHSRVFIGVGGLGLDAEAAHVAGTRFRHFPGALRYVAAVLWALRTFKPLIVSAVMESERIEVPVLFAAAANASAYGSGVKIAPRARMDDGLMDLTLVGDLPWHRIFEAILILLRNGDLRWPEVRRFRVTRVRLSSDRVARFHGDGEILGEVGPGAPVEVEVLPAGVRVVASPWVQPALV